MNRVIASACTLAIVTLAAACSQQNSQKKEDNAAVVNGHAISLNTFNEFAKGAAGKPAEDLTAAQRTELLDNLIRAEVIAADAEAKGVAQQDETRAGLDLARLNVLSQAATQYYLKDRKASEEELRAEYDLQVAGMSKVEYRASHILVPTEESARQVIAQLKAGANFADLARRLSADKTSAANGGDLEWFAPSSMTPVFADAIIGLKKGETSQTPVKTEYGWHVLRVTDTRASVPPPYEGVKDRLGKLVESKKFKAYADDLVAKAKVTRTLK
jgi:peptidyl-prolyl cis-trans isomerase C